MSTLTRQTTVADTLRIPSRGVDRPWAMDGDRRRQDYESQI